MKNWLPFLLLIRAHLGYANEADTVLNKTYSVSNSTFNIGLLNHKVTAHLVGLILPNLDFSFLGIFESIKYGLTSGTPIALDTCAYKNSYRVHIKNIQNSLLLTSIYNTKLPWLMV